MVGVIINVAAVLAGGTLGLLLGGRVPQRLREKIMQGLALCILLIGAQGALETANVLAVIVCMVAGGLLGETLDIEKRLESLGALAERKFAHGGQNGRFAQGFITASLLFCVGAMAVVGSLNAGLTGDNSTLIAKAALDLVTAVFFAAALGPGVLLAAAAVLVYQDAIALIAGWLAPVLTDAIVTEMSAVGGLLIMGLSFNMLGMAKIRVGNLLPAIFLPILYFPIANWIGGLL